MNTKVKNMNMIITIFQEDPSYRRPTKYVQTNNLMTDDLPADAMGEAMAHTVAEAKGLGFKLGTSHIKVSFVKE